LEKNSYIPAIKQAITHALQQRAGKELYLLDLMAGGHGGRSEELLAEFPALHILSIDRDAPQRTLSDRHQWVNLEFGEKSLAETRGADPFALSALLLKAFYNSNGTTDV
jgi:16S rRNA C1402 N4-methylase RsmH